MLAKIPKVLIFIFVLALFLRLFKLDTYPVGFHSDEARVAWNSYSLLKTGMDDRGNKLPLYYDTFGDYRPTGIFYFTIPSLILFGRNIFAVRFPSSFFGALTVFPLYFFVLEILKDTKPKIKSKQIALLSVFLLAISPWHIEVSRATSEVAISTFFAISSLYFLVKLIKSGKAKFAIYTCLFTLISYLLYHAIRLLAPLFFLTVFLFYFQKIKSAKYKKLIIGSVIFAFALTLLFSTTPQARKRFDQVSIFNDSNTVYEIQRIKDENKNINILTRIFDNKYVIYTKEFLMEYSSYFSGDFLIGYSARPYRYATPGSGLLTYIEFGLFGVGILEVAKRKRNFLPLILLLISPLPAALTVEDGPNLHRAFLMVPFLVIITATGLEYLIEISKKYKKFIKPLPVRKILILTIFVSTIYFLYMYFNHSNHHKPFIKDYALDGSSYRNVGTKELAEKLYKLKDNYDKIIVTNLPDDPYPWYAFFNNIDPKEFNQYAVSRDDHDWQYKNIVFSRSHCPSDNDAFSKEKVSKLLIIDSGSSECAYNAEVQDGLKAKIIDKITRANGTEVYVFLERK